MLVYVLNKHGKPLMPCRPHKARILLRDKKAKVVNNEPFTIQLLYGSSGHKQPITLGVDPGYNFVGLSAVTDGQEVYRSELRLRLDISKLLLERHNFRKMRRRRKTRYRKQRFLNRVRPKGWLNPSIRNKLDSTIKAIENVKKILPISNTIIEVATFDTQKMQNPEISGIEYQQGTLQGYEVREYLLEKWHRTCAYCGKKNVPLEVEHIIPEKRGGSNRVSNLTMSCRECNEEKDNRTAAEFGHPEIQTRAIQPLKETTYMNIVRWRLVNTLDCEYTYGYKTKHDRIKLGLEKSHSNDAFAIAGGTEDTARLDHVLIQKQVRRNNRKLFKGDHSHIPNQCEREIFGFRRFDKVMYNGQKYFVWGRRKRGQFLIKDLLGNKAEPRYKKLKKIKGRTAFLTELQ